MKILILGFNDYAELDAVMQNWIESTKCFLFNVITLTGEGIAADWARKNGAPLYFLKRDADIGYLSWAADFLVLKLDDNTPQSYKNLLMQMKAAGKHGKVVK